MDNLAAIHHFLQLSPSLLTGGQPTEAQLEMLAKAGVKTVINLALSQSSGALANEQGMVRHLGMNYIHIPVIWENPTRSDLAKFNTAMEAQGEQKIFVHCAANMRVSVFIALYRIQKLGWIRERAFRNVYRIWDPFSNPTWTYFIESVLGEE